MKVKKIIYKDKCVNHTLKGTYKSFKYIYIFKVLLNVISSLIKRKKISLQLLKKLLFSNDTLRLTGFVVSYTFLIKFLTCFSRFLFKHKNK